MKAKTERLEGCARDIMQTDLITVSLSTPLSDVALALTENRISGVPVTDPAGHIAGVVTLHDVAAHCAESPNPLRTAVSNYYLVADDRDDIDYTALEVPSDSAGIASDAMSAAIYDVADDEGVAAVAAKMVELGIHRVLVCNASGKHVGLISSFDILRAVASRG